jgi:hypothetical protein
MYIANSCNLNDAWELAFYPQVENLNISVFNLILMTILKYKQKCTWKYISIKWKNKQTNTSQTVSKSNRDMEHTQRS